ncbi:MAG: rod shape-determining protein MreC [Lachnospiraceae bacterium]|nr:rod shape-determining protein MreC [Lachnospiraceae bacterium]MBR3807130.1 rod shape-determining protein MreC [Lachnospiraceae bacterium]MBR4061187.1 rod shape-determining protein MreC [Lachnospiraceae bacterium]
MSPLVKKKGEKFTIPSKYLLFALTSVCAVMVILSLFTNVFEAVLNRVAGNMIIPFQRGITYVGGFITDKADNLREIEALLEENDLLKTKVDELTLEINRLQQDKYELAHLQELFKLDAQYESYEKVGARIIGSESVNWYHSFLIDKGSDDGLKVNMNVIADGGLVGIITDVGSNWSRVTSIISDEINLMGRVLSTEDNLIVSGNLATVKTNGTISFSQLLDTDDQVHTGDKVVTSSISDKYLPGLVIGYIDKAGLDANNMTKSGSLLPVVDFNHLDEVLIILDLKENYEE